MTSGRGHFVGRRGELRLLNNALGRARSGDPQIVLVEGEAGIGKSALVLEFASRLQDAALLEASGDETEETLDYGVIAQIISGPVAASVGLEDLPSEPSSAGRATPLSMGAALLRALGSLQDRGVVVIVVDDVHWADLLSAQALVFALRRLRADRVLVLLASRADRHERLGESWLKLLADSQRVQRVRLGGLEVSDVRLLARSFGAGPLSAAMSERLHRHTGGNPLHLTALLDELPSEALAKEGPLPAPRSFAGAVLPRLARLPGPAQNLVTAVAAAGTQCRFEVAARAAGIDDPVGALDDAVAAGMLEVLGPGLAGDVRFPHPLVRAAVYEDLSPSRRQTLHLALAELTDGSAALGHRVAASLGSDAELARELVSMAEAEMERGAVPQAAEHLLAASRVSGPADAGRLLQRAVEALIITGDLPRAARLRSAVEATEDGLFKSYVLGCLTASAGLLHEAAAEFTCVVEAAPNGDLGRRAASWLALVLANLGRSDQAALWAERALAEPGVVPTVTFVARLALTQAAAPLCEDTGPTALRDGARGGRPPAPFQADLVAARACLQVRRGDRDRGRADLEAVIGWFRDGTWVNGIAQTYASLAEAEYRAGDWDDGLVHAEVGVSLGEEGARNWELPYIHAVASSLHTARGNWVDAERHAAAARETGRLTQHPAGLRYASLAWARVAYARGDAAAVLLALRSQPEDADHESGTEVGRSLEVEALLATGRVGEASFALQRLETLGAGSPEAGLQRCRLRALVAFAQGRHDAARSSFARALELASGINAPLLRALLELDYGRFLRTSGNRREALKMLRSALGRFKQLEARPWFERCEVELSACGVRATELDQATPFGLTAREQVVARLVASGKSNREVASELYLSTKAIEFHLGNVFDKVGVHSRRELGPRLVTSPSQIH